MHSSAVELKGKLERGAWLQPCRGYSMRKRHLQELLSNRKRAPLYLRLGVGGALRLRKSQTFRLAPQPRLLSVQMMEDDHL